MPNTNETRQPAGPIGQPPEAATTPRMPATVIAALVLLTVSVVWWLVELPDAVAGIAGPFPASTPGGLEVLVIVLITLPALVELAALVGIGLGFAWTRWLLVVVAAFFILSSFESLASGETVQLLNVAIPLVAFTLTMLPPSRAWFAARKAHRRPRRAALTG